MRVSGAKLWLYAGDCEVFGDTFRCVVVVFVAAYRINAPTNKPVYKIYNRHHHAHFSHTFYANDIVIIDGIMFVQLS